MRNPIHYASIKDKLVKSSHDLGLMSWQPDVMCWKYKRRRKRALYWKGDYICIQRETRKKWKKVKIRNQIEQ